ncbi:MAG TPA: hypothetical protein VGL65_11460 [Gemmatimonadales bacterium]|jgi:hypothetical protein
MTTSHLDMDQLLALRDGDRSEPGIAATQLHLASCAVCQLELDRLHQRTARLRALPSLAPVQNEFPAVRDRLAVDRRRKNWRATATIGLAAAAALLVTLIGRDLVHPTRLDAEEELKTEISRSQQLEQELHDWNPDQRVIDGSTAVVVIQLENRIAALDAQLSAAAQLNQKARMHRELQLWQQRVGLMTALVDVHVTKTSNVGM